MTGRIRCHYATQPTTRPDCQFLAAVRYGQLALCPSCDQRRSTLGKELSPTRLNTTHLDVLVWIEQAHRDLHSAEHDLAAAVHRARQQGQPWSAIGTSLQISRQAAQQRFPDPSGLSREAPHRQSPRGRPQRQDTKGKAALDNDPQYE